MSDATPKAPVHPQPPQGPIAFIMTAPLRLLGLLTGALILSIIIEWAGMAWLWPEQSWHHAQKLLNDERLQLSSDIAQSRIVQEPARIAQTLVAQTHEWLFTSTELADRIQDTSRRASVISASHRDYIGVAYAYAERYLMAAAYRTLVFLVRLLVLSLSLPLFLLAAFVGLVDGLVRRDLRRFGAGRESSFIYHRARASLMPLAALPWVCYLVLPCSLHPLWVLLPCAFLLGLAINIAAASFKKYL